MEDKKSKPPPIYHFRSNWCLIHAACILASFSTRHFLDCTETSKVLIAVSSTSFFLLFVQAVVQHETDITTPPNLITEGRLFGAMFYFHFFSDLSLFWRNVGAIVLFLGDFADGWVARRFDMVSEFGAFMDGQSDMFLTLLISQYFTCQDLILPILGVHMGFSAYLYVLITGTILTEHTPTVHRLAKPLAGCMALSLFICMGLHIFGLAEAAYWFGNIAGVCNLISFTIEYISMMGTCLFGKPVNIPVDKVIENLESEPLRKIASLAKKQMKDDKHEV